MVANLIGKQCQVIIRQQAGDAWMNYDLTARVVKISLDRNRLGVTFDDSPFAQQIAGVVAMDVELCGCVPVARRTTHEQMALAVLTGDRAAAAMLADCVINDLQWKSEGGLTRDDLLSRIDDLQKQLRDANDRIEALGHPAPVFPEVDPWAGTY